MVAVAFFLAAMIFLFVRVIVSVSVSVAVLVTMGSVTVAIVMTMSSVTVAIVMTMSSVTVTVVAMTWGKEPISSIVVGDVCECSILDVSSKDTFLGEGRGVLL